MNPQKLEKILQLQTYGMYYLTCYLWAKFFEDNNMAWVYCPESGRDGMVDGAADFYLPDQDAYMLADLGRPGRKYINIQKLANDSGKTIILGGAQGKFSILEEGKRGSGPDAWLCECAACRRYYFMNSSGGFACRVCGEHDGDHHLQNVMYGDDGLFGLQE